MITLMPVADLMGLVMTWLIYVPCSVISCFALGNLHAWIVAVSFLTNIFKLCLWLHEGLIPFRSWSYFMVDGESSITSLSLVSRYWIIFVLMYGSTWEHEKFLGWIKWLFLLIVMGLIIVPFLKFIRGGQSGFSITL